MVSVRVWLVGAVVLMAVGCSNDARKAEVAEENFKPASVTVRLLVVDDPSLARQIKRLPGEWHAKTGHQLKVSEMGLDEFQTTNSIAADAVIYPSSELGDLIVEKRIRPIASQWLDSEDFDRNDVFELLRTREIVWAASLYAVPCGSAVFTCYYRADLFERFKRKPPQTWAEYQDVAAFFYSRENLGDAAPPAGMPWFGTIEPLAEGWASRLFLARAAAYAKHRDYYSTLFDANRMEPRIDSPPFVRALDELAAAAKTGTPEQVNYGPAEVRKAFRDGNCAMAISWPTAAEDASVTKPAESKTSIGFSELPGALEVYIPSTKRWEKRRRDEAAQVPLLGVSGRLGSVTRSAAHADEATRLITWLSGRQWSSQIFPHSETTTLFRRSQMPRAEQWMEPGTTPEAGKQYAASVEQTLNSSQSLEVLRIPGHKQYNAALDGAVRDVVSGKRSAAEALNDAAQRWRAITAERGLEKQRAAYRASLGLEP